LSVHNFTQNPVVVTLKYVWSAETVGEFWFG